MALGIVYICNSCSKEIEAWDEGDPYLLDAKGKKQYRYHPDPERELCIGVESPHLCLDCGKQFAVDSEKPITACPKCDSIKIKDTFLIDGCLCPFCKEGNFVEDTTRGCIS